MIYDVNSPTGNVQALPIVCISSKGHLSAWERKVPHVFSWHGVTGVSECALVLRYLPDGEISLLFLVNVPPIGIQCCLWLISLYSSLLPQEMLWMGFRGQLGLPLLLLSTELPSSPSGLMNPTHPSLSYRIKFACTAQRVAVPGLVKQHPWCLKTEDCQEVYPQLLCLIALCTNKELQQA